MEKDRVTTTVKTNLSLIILFMISIIVTAYNVAPFIEQCLTSCSSQSYRDIEVIVVLDCPTDDTERIVRHAAKRDKRIVVISNETNLGAGMSRRIGIDSAKGEYVLLLDGDDYLAENFIEDLVHRAGETDADIVSGGVTIFEEVSGRFKAETFGLKTSKGMQRFEDYGAGHIIFLNNKLVRRRLYEQVPYCGRRYCEDTPVVIPLLYLCNMVAYCNNAGYFYRQHDASLCHHTDSFRQNLYKGLCALDCIRFFADKEDEYRNLVPPSQMLQHVFALKTLAPEPVLNAQETAELAMLLINALQFLNLDLSA